MIEYKYKLDDRVSVDYRYGYPADQAVATITELKPYEGRPGYYMVWDYGRKRQEWESEGGWVSESILRAA